jgi:hypothetical protein
MTNITVTIPNKTLLKRVVAFFETLHLSFKIEENKVSKVPKSPLPDGCGAWEDDRTEDEIIADIRALRHSNPLKDTFSL